MVTVRVSTVFLRKERLLPSSLIPSLKYFCIRDLHVQISRHNSLMCLPRLIYAEDTKEAQCKAVWMVEWKENVLRAEERLSRYGGLEADCCRLMTVSRSISSSSISPWANCVGLCHITNTPGGGVQLKSLTHSLMQLLVCGVKKI